MAEEKSLRPASSGARAFVSQSAPRNSGIRALSDLVTQSAGLATDALADAAQREEAEALDILSSPTVTPEEVNEVVDNATFERARKRGKERRGQLLAEDYRIEAEKVMRDAPDAIEGRRRLREIEQGALEGISDARVRAGVREGFAEYTPRLLDEAAKRRTLIADQAEDESSAYLFRRAASRDTHEFLDLYATETDLEYADGTDIPAWNNNLAEGLGNYYAEGTPDPNSENYDPTAINPRGDRALAHIDALLKSGMVEGASRTPWVKLRSEILADREEALTATTLAAERKAEHASALARGVEWRREHPGQILPPHIQDEIYATAEATGLPSTISSAQTFVLAAPEAVNAPGISGSPIVIQGLRDLKQSGLDASGVPNNDENYLASIRVYNQTMLHAPPHLVEDPIALQSFVDRTVKSLSVDDEAEVTRNRNVGTHERYKALISGEDDPTVKGEQAPTQIQLELDRFAAGHGLGPVWEDTPENRQAVGAIFNPADPEAGFEEFGEAIYGDYQEWLRTEINAYLLRNGLSESDIVPIR